MPADVCLVDHGVAAGGRVVTCEIPVAARPLDGGMEGLVKRVVEAINGDYVLNAPVEKIHSQDGKVTGLTVAGRDLSHSRIVSNIPLWAMDKIVQSENQETRELINRIKKIQTEISNVRKKDMLDRKTPRSGW